MALQRFEDLKYVHIIGVCGTLMGAFAAFLKRRGIEVSGSDQNIYPPMSDVLARAQVDLFPGYSADNLTRLGKRPDLVVIGNVIPRINPEAQGAMNGGYEFTSLPEAMERLMLAETRNFVVAGTHGKTTTSSLLAFVFSKCGLDPNYFIGGVSHDLPTSFHISSLKGQVPFVLEGDEYDTAFWDKVPKFNHYLPDDVILTSVEYDHADIYPDMASVEKAFFGLMDRIRPGGHLIACIDFESVARVIKRARVEIETYSADSRPKYGISPDYWSDQVVAQGDAIEFDVIYRGKKQDRVSLKIPGQHNVMNALAVWIECKNRGLKAQAVREALARFQGVKRRQEVRGEIRGRLMIDDFAHHPTAVRETLRALKLKYPDRRLVTVFEPRSATSRRKVFQKDYVQALGEASVVYIAAPYDQSKIAESDQFSSAQLVSDLCQLGVMASPIADIDQGAIDVARQSDDGDLIAILSNGGFGGFIEKLMKALRSSDI